MTGVNTTSATAGLLSRRSTYLALAAAVGALAAYYCAAQAIDLPGSGTLRERWSGLTSAGGTRGHKMKNKRMAGPVEASVLGMVVIALVLKGTSIRDTKK